VKFLPYSTKLKDLIFFRKKDKLMSVKLSLIEYLKEEVEKFYSVLRKTSEHNNGTLCQKANYV